MDDKTKLSYWLGQTGGRTNAAYTLQKEYKHALQGRGPGPRTLKKDMVSTTPSAPSISTPTGHQYNSPPVFGSQSRPLPPTDPFAHTPNNPNQAFGMRSPAGARGLVDFQPAGNKVPLETKHAAGMAAIIAAPFALAAAVPAVVTGVAGASAIGAYGGLGAGLAGAGGLAARFVRGAGGVVSKTATATRSAVSPGYRATTVAAEEAAKNAAKKAAAATRAAAKKAADAKKAAAKKAADDAAQKGKTAAAQNYAGALGQQEARLGGSGARR